MTLTPDDESLILSGRRLVPDECGDAFFDFVAAELRKNDGTPVFGIVRNAVQAPSPPAMPGLRLTPSGMFSHFLSLGTQQRN